MMNYLKKYPSILIWLVGVLAGSIIGWSNANTDHALLVNRVEALEAGHEETEPAINSIPVILEKINQIYKDITEIKSDIKEMKGVK